MKINVLILLIFFSFQGVSNSQSIVKVSDLLDKDRESFYGGRLVINHDAAIDTLVSRYIEANRKAGGMEGYRIQVYRKGRAPKEDADKAYVKAISEFPDLKAYQDFEIPNFYIVRLGDFRNRIVATRMLDSVRTVFPDAYLVRVRINFPDDDTDR